MRCTCVCLCVCERARVQNCVHNTHTHTHKHICNSVSTFLWCVSVGVFILFKNGTKQRDGPKRYPIPLRHLASRIKGRNRIVQSSMANESILLHLPLFHKRFLSIVVTSTPHPHTPHLSGPPGVSTLPSLTPPKKGLGS